MKAILATWPRKPESPDDAARRLGQFLADDFDIADLANTPHGDFDVISRGLQVGSEAIFVVRESVDPNVPNLARLKRGPDQIWRLTSFKFQCQTCFGSGIYGNEPCNVCGTEGWGIKESIPLD